MRRVRRVVSVAVLSLALSASPAWAASSPAATTPAPHHSSSGRQAGEIVGFVGLVGLLVAWSEGYGLLGGRHRRRAQVPGRGPDNPDA